MSKELRELLNQLDQKNKTMGELLNKEGVTKEELENISNEIDVLQAKVEAQKKKDNVDNNFNDDTKNYLNNNMTLINNNHDKISTDCNITMIDKSKSLYNAIIKNDDKKNLSIGKYVKGMLTGNWSNATNEMREYRALNTSTGSTLIPSELSAQILDLARSQMALGDIPIVPMTTNNLTIAKIEKDPEFKFKGELAKSDISDMSFGSVELRSKTVYGLMKISLELLESAKNIDTVIKDAMAKSIAQCIDKAGLYGEGDGKAPIYKDGLLNGIEEEPKGNKIEPKGILTYDNINIITSDPIEKSKYTSFIKGIGEITKANGVPNTIAYNSNIDTSINLLTDTTGQPLNAPKIITDLSHNVSNNIKDNQVIVFDKNSIVLGLQNKIRIDVSHELGFEDGSVWLRIYAMLDFAILNPKNITKIEYK
ncbi:putative phage capsid protein [Clostridium botulinum C str. Eklund]|nr:putative phage capsid protein [Clostridium botulinum C str. Eklund]NEZ50200.1 phage major capsid protein [Clostridium botulinum]